tara:strand:+ start:196 stop:447 length:252 start_codon:yes stop_codon:yes gene_type:complete
MFEPITLPIDKPGEFFITASTETNNSGKDVPKPITIRPIKNSETLNLLPSAIELDKRISAPLTTKNKPNNNSKVWLMIIGNKI